MRAALGYPASTALRRTSDLNVHLPKPPRRAALLVAGLLFASASFAQQPASSYPAHDLRLIIPFPPGGGNDAVARLLAGRLQSSLHRAVVLENRGGAGGTLGTQLAAKAPPDGYTLLINNISLAINASLYRKLPYDVARDLAPVSIVGRQPSVLMVQPKLGVTSVRELLDLARRKPGELIYGSGGTGSSSHLATERLLFASKTRMAHVPYKGLADAVTDLSSGRVDVVMATASTVLPLMKKTDLHPLAVSTAQRSPLFPGLATLAESGLPGFEVSTWYALLVPARTPAAVVARLNAELGRISRAEDVKTAFAAQGLDATHTTPPEAAKYIRSEIDRWAQAVRASNVKLE
jgi:tripartite-type tricarboxylate transporter receptor subunit TctC